MAELYPWERLWCPRSAAPKIDEDGCTALPSTHPYLDTNKHLKHLKDLEAEPVVILLGEPGIGKSKALEQESHRLLASDASLSFIPLDSRDIYHHVFDEPRLHDWVQNPVSAHFTLLLDGLDYGRHLLPDVGQLLRNGLQSLPKEHLRLRITCRSVEWLPTLEQELRRLWGKDQVSVYHLSPLTSIDVKTACEIEDIDFGAFSKEVTRVGAGPLASSPVTLELLFKLFRADNHLPHTRWDTYEQGCMRLAAEVNPYWQEVGANARSSETGERLITAGRIALLALMTNHPEIQEDEDQHGQITWEDITGQPDEESQGIPFTVKKRIIRETLNTGLFKPLEKGVFRAAHQTYSEFLAAYYLTHRQVPLRQLISLFSHPDGGSDLPPQLVATAAWLAMRNKDFRSWAIGQDPTVMLQSDVLALPEIEREHIATKLLEAAANNRFSVWDVRFSRSLELLNCPGLAECLSPWLDDATQPDNARVLAVSIAIECTVETVLPSLVEIVLSETASKELRVVAGYAIAHYGQPEHRVRMKDLLPFRADDPEEELRGTALQALWPDFLSTKELLLHLTRPHRSGFHGAYQGFLSRFVNNLPQEDLPYALSWLLNHGVSITETTIGLRENQESEVRFASNPLAPPTTQILQRAWQSWDNPSVQPMILKYLIAYRDERHSVNFSHLFGDKILTPQETENDGRKRRELFVKLLSLESEREVYSWTLLSIDVDPPLLNETDSDWLWQQAVNATTDEKREAYAYCAYMTSSIADGRANVRLEELSHSYPALLSLKERFSMSENMRIESARNREKKEELSKQQKAVRIQKQQHIIKEKLDAFETGRLDEWTHILNSLQLKENGFTHGNIIQNSVMETPGWKDADATMQSRIVEAASRYLCESEMPEPPANGRQELAIYPGYRALELLAIHDFTRIKNWGNDLWRRWTPAIVAVRMSSSMDSERTRHIELIKLAYVHASEEFIYSLKRAVLEDLVAYHSLPPQLTGTEFYEIYDHPVWEMMWELIQENPSQEYLFIISEWLLDATRDTNPLPEIHERVRAKLVSLLNDESLKTRAAWFLFSFARGAGWADLWHRIQQNAIFGRAWAEYGRGMWFFSDRPLNELSEAELGELYVWVATQYPDQEDPVIDGVHSIQTRESIGRWRDAILQNLIARETPEALIELRRVSLDHPEWKGLSDYTIPRFERKIRERTWRATSASAILELLSQSERRLVRSAGELEIVVQEALKVLQNKIADAVIPEIEFLWNDNPAKPGIQLQGRPKTEEALSNYIAAHINRELQQRRIIVNREVQVHHNRGRLDIRIEAFPQGRHTETEESVTVVIEVKGCWNRELKTALETQLAQDYLRQHPDWRGIYLVGWYLCDFWESDDKKKATERLFKSKEEASDFFSIQAKKVAHDHQVAVNTFILDARRASKHYPV